MYPWVTAPDKTKHIPPLRLKVTAVHQTVKMLSMLYAHFQIANFLLTDLQVEATVLNLFHAELLFFPLVGLLF